jgi:histidine triad (HIT) family protein
MEQETIFQKIVQGEIPSTSIYEDDRFFAFLDINPVSKGHVLLITKEPYRWMADVPDESISQIFARGKTI